MIVIPYTTTSRSTLAPHFARSFDRLFDESLDRVLKRPAAAAPARTPAMDVSESDDAYTVVFDVPGVTRDQLKVTVEGRKLTIDTAPATEAPKTPDAAVAEAAPQANTSAAVADNPAATPRALYRERPIARYARTVVLPAEVDQAASQARFDNGVLTLTLAKRVPHAATQINIG